MSYNGSGTFVINTAGQPVVSGTVISSTAFNALTADLATGLSTAITKDGQTTPTANIPMGNNKITGLAVGTAATDAANLSQVQSTAAKLVNSVSGADTITGTMSPNLGAYATGQMFYFVAVGANTGAVTINIDSLGAKSITRDGTTALAAGDIQSGEVCVIVYDGTQFQLVNGASQSASIVTENLTVNKATVLNESGGDNDTRVEGDTDANLVFVDASTDRVGVGTNTPGTKFDVAGIIRTVGTGYSAANSPTLYLENTTASTGRRYALNSANSGIFQIADDTAGGASRIILDSSGNLGLGVTPSAWSGVTAAQILRGSIYGSNDAVGVQHNTYFDGSNWKYIASSVAASQYDQYQGSHRWFYAASGTAGNNISWTQAMTLDALGRLGIGTTSPSEKLEVAGAVKLTAGNLSVVPSTTTNAAVTICTNGGGTFFAGLDNSTGGTFGVGNYSSVLYNGANTPMVFFTNAAERARISAAGDFLWGATTLATVSGGNSDAKGIDYADGMRLFSSRSNTASREHIVFYNPNGDVGSIDTNASATAYNTSSDARLKKNIVDAQDAGSDVDALQVRQFDWKVDDLHVKYGFVAQELYAVAPEAVTPGDDGEEIEKTWGVDYSKLVPMLIKEVQSLRKRVAELEAK